MHTNMLQYEGKADEQDFAIAAVNEAIFQREGPGQG